MRKPKRIELHTTKKGREQLARIKKGKKITELAEVEMEPDLETRVLRLENASSAGEAAIYKIKKLEEQIKKLEMMLETLIIMSKPVAQPRQPRYRSSEWHMRSGNVYQDIALPGSPNGQETKAAPAGKTPDDQRGDLPPSK